MARNSDILGNLGNILSQQYGLDDPKTVANNIAANGNNLYYSQLGDFASGFDQTTDRSYTEEGSFRTEYNFQTPKQREILMQEPNITVLVKKRAFSSLAENFRPDLMDQSEKLFYKATKVLFNNKANQISAFEKLSKINTISTEIGRVDVNLLPILFSLTDTLNQVPTNSGSVGSNNSINNSLTNFGNVINRVREIVALSNVNYYTTWITGNYDSFKSSLGTGTGTIEFTNITSLQTTTTLKFATGQFSLSFTDPYELMRITNLDIEQAISDTINRFYANNTFQLGITSLDQNISSQKQQLNALRISRGASTISFTIEQQSFLGQRVFAIIDDLGFQINYSGSTIDPSALFGSNQLGDQGLNPNETILFNDIISSIYDQISLVSNSRTAAFADNQDPTKNLNALRKKLRLHYGSKLIIQPMDNVHIYISSKKRLDSGLIGGLQSNFSGNGFMQGLSTYSQDIKDSLSAVNNYSFEKSVFVGDDFPNWLWLAMRNQFVSDQSGSHVFAGVVENASGTYTNGNFTVSASGQDNAAYFNYGVVNFAPSLDVYNDALYDPLTPFKLEFDSVSGVQKNDTLTLLDENLGLFTSAFVKDKNGLFAGVKSTEANFTNQDADRIKDNSIRRVFYDPDGMVYRWKEGIASIVLYGDSYTSTPTNNNTPANTTNVFAGQDVVNTLSLLITGEPYNYNTFYKAATQFDSGFFRDSKSNRDASGSYLRGLTNRLKERNAIYGHFIPFKSLVMDENTYKKVLNNQITATAYDKELQALITKRAEIADQLSIIGKNTAASLSNGSDPIDIKTANVLNGLDQQIQAKLNQIANNLNNNANAPIPTIGNDSSYDPSNINPNADKTRLDNNNRKDLRRKVALQTRRLTWKVRGNTDVNYLIVDDIYDKDTDIQAFEQAFIQPEVFKSDYLTVAQKINSVGSVLNGFELFCNTQGHIEIRNPKYNKIPSSIFAKMIQMKNELGIQIYPQFLEDLALNQLDDAFDNISVLEDEIRMYCLTLGYITDGECSTFINSGDTIKTGNIGKFQFLSDEKTGKITSGIKALIAASQPDFALNSVQTKLSTFQSQSNTSVFGLSAVANIVQSNLIPPADPNNPTQFASLPQILSNQDALTRQTTITNALQSITSQTFDLTQLLGNSSNNIVSSVDILKITLGISTRISSRQKLIKTAANALKNIKEGLQISVSNNATDSNQRQSNILTTQNLLNINSKSIPQSFEHMIEDETFDDLGPGSCNRYIIKNRDILRYTIEEKRPEYTAVEVTGRLNLLLNNGSLPQDLAVSQSGNALTTAAAIDYDLWRMYGVWQSQPIDAPFLSNPNTQCAPYAVSLLNKARKEILAGTALLVGNEYQQPGEVLYFENLDILFYIDSVTHSFGVGSQFTTEVKLSYGHNIGEYIPTFYDVIGKNLYKNKDVSHFVHKKQGNVFNEEHIGTIVGNFSNSNPNSSVATTGFATPPPTTSNQSQTNSSIAHDVNMGQFQDSNRFELQKIINLATTSLSLSNNNLTPKLEIRIYYNSSISDFQKPNTYNMNLQNYIISYLNGSTDGYGNSNTMGDAMKNSQVLSAFKNQIIPVNVDSNINTLGQYRYPSKTAFYSAREVIDKTGQGSVNNLQQKIDNVIYSCIVDCWVVFSNPNL